MTETKRRKPAATPPLTSHPLFPVTVLLWFGALFGLSSIAIRSSLIEHIVLVAGIDRVIPMAAPPLGNTMRVLLALLMTGIGCMVGGVVARLLTRSAPKPAATRRHQAGATPEAESPVTKFGKSEPEADADALADEEELPLPTVRRRQLLPAPAEPIAATEDAPLPGTSPILKVADLEIASFDAALEEEEWQPLRKRSAKPLAEVELSATPEPSRLHFGRAAPIEPHDEDTAQIPKPGFELLPRIEDEPLAAEGTPAAVASEVERQPEVAAIEHEPEVAPEPEIEQPTVSAAPARVTSRPIPASAAERLANAPLDDLSHIELLERLALTIARRREAAAALLAAAAAKASISTEGDAPFGLRAVHPQPDHGDEAVPAAVAPRFIGAPVAPDDIAEGEDILASGYTSLRGLTRSTPLPTPPQGEAGASNVRAFDAPASRNRETDRTEQALRDALATLQRMSGAA